MNSNNRLWQVKLTLMGDNDPKLSALTERMREETEGVTGWHQLSQF